MTKEIDVLITYLEQTAPTATDTPPPIADQLAVIRVLKPSPHYYRYLYDVVGRPHCWVSRRNLTDKELLTIIHHKATYIYTLLVNGNPAGFCEIDTKRAGQCEIKFFGLVPEYIGRGLGRFFLSQMIKTAWGFNPARLLLETCTLDHPAALPLYQKMGFHPFDQKRGTITLPADMSVPVYDKNTVKEVDYL